MYFKYTAIDHSAINPHTVLYFYNVNALLESNQYQLFRRQMPYHCAKDAFLRDILQIYLISIIFSLNKEQKKQMKKR